MIRRLPALLAILWFAGCATEYQPMGFTGGYRDTHIKDNVYFVEVATNAYTSQVAAVSYFHRRAKEVCSENGYGNYRIRSERDTSTQFVRGSYGYGSASATSMNRPGVSGYVECQK